MPVTMVPRQTWPSGRGGRLDFHGNDPRCGREHFDARAGVEWVCGIDPWDVSGCIPDVRWNKYRETLELPNRLRFDGGQWAVTDFGLELISDVPERNERIPVSRLLAKHADGPVYWWAVTLAKEPWVDLYAFEVALKKALEIHRLTADESILYKSFRTAHALARNRARGKRIKPNLPPRLPNVRGAMWLAGTETSLALV